MTRHDFTTLRHRLSRAGFNKEFVRAAILPDWWDDTCSEDSSLLQDIEIRAARFLGLPLAAVTDTSASLTPRAYAGAQLRRVRDVDRDRLAAAIHSGIRIAESVVRNLRDKQSDAHIPFDNALAWRERIERVDRTVTLIDVVSDLWKRGIPVVLLDVLPVPSFQGMTCVAEGRPVILLGHKHDEPGRVAFLVAHEVGHLAAGDCAPERPVVDEEEEITDEAQIEVRADQYASRVLIGNDTVAEIDATGFKELARRASEAETQTGADASILIFAWARRTGDYATATMAVRALYRHLGARRQLAELFCRHVDLSNAAETDRALLRCVYAYPEHDEAVG